MATVGEKMTAIANAIRTKTGGTAKLTLDTMASSLNNIPERTSSNLSASGATVTVPAGNYKTQATKSVATATRANTTISTTADDTNDKLTITASNNQGTGYVTGANKTASTTISLTASGATVTASDGSKSVSKSVTTVGRADTTISVSADDTNDKLTITASNNQGTGYVTGANKTATKTITLTASGSSVTASDGTNKVSKSVATATQATPSISVNSSGLITASAKQTAGYVAAGTKSATKQLTTKAATTITPGTRNQTVAAGTYLTGALTIAGDADLVAANIVSGKNIFNVAGSHTCANNVLNFKVVGGTTKPSSPTTNTIWVNTSTSITDYVFSTEQPQASNGRIWIITDKKSTTAFNAVKNSVVTIYPMCVKQCISGAFVNVDASIYQNNKWIDLSSEVILFLNGDRYTSITGDWNGYDATLDVNGYFGRDYTGMDYWALVRYYTNKSFDLTDYSTVIVEIDSMPNGTIDLAIRTKPTDTKTTIATASITQAGTLSLDISNITGSYQITVDARSYGVLKYRITKIAL